MKSEHSELLTRSGPGTDRRALPPLLASRPRGTRSSARTEAARAREGNRARGAPTRAEHLARHYSCILFDRRERGLSGGRVENITWAHYVAQAKGMPDHLGIERAHLMGGCMGCAPVAAFGVAHPQATLSMILWWPVGGAKYRIKGQQRFREHLAFVRDEGLPRVVERVRTDGKACGADPRGGPWASLIKRDAAFAEAYAKLDREAYARTVEAMSHALLDRDTAPGAEPEDLLALQVPALVVPGRDESHATSAVRYLEECIPGAQYWDAALGEQTEASAPQATP